MTKHQPMLQVAGWLILLCLPCQLMAQADAIGKVILASGGVDAIDVSGQQRELSRGAEVFVQDTINTQEDGFVQIRLVDDAIITFRKNTTFSFLEYAYDGQGGAVDNVLMELVRGGFRTIDGFVGDDPQNGYDVQTRFGNIGVRGTTYDAVIDEALNALFTGVYDGGIYVSNTQGSLDQGLGANFDFSVTRDGQAPEGLLNIPEQLGNSNVEGVLAANNSIDETNQGRGNEAESDEGNFLAANSEQADVPVNGQLNSVDQQTTPGLGEIFADIRDEDLNPSNSLNASNLIAFNNVVNNDQADVGGVPETPGSVGTPASSNEPPVPVSGSASAATDDPANGNSGTADDLTPDQPPNDDVASNPEPDTNGGTGAGDLIDEVVDGGTDLVDNIVGEDSTVGDLVDGVVDTDGVEDLVDGVVDTDGVEDLVDGVVDTDGVEDLVDGIVDTDSVEDLVDEIVDTEEVEGLVDEIVDTGTDIIDIDIPDIADNDTPPDEGQSSGDSTDADDTEGGGLLDSITDIVEDVVDTTEDVTDPVLGGEDGGLLGGLFALTVTGDNLQQQLSASKADIRSQAQGLSVYTDDDQNSVLLGVKTGLTGTDESGRLAVAESDSVEWGYWNMPDLLSPSAYDSAETYQRVYLASVTTADMDALKSTSGKWSYASIPGEFLGEASNGSLTALDMGFNVDLATGAITDGRFSAEVAHGAETWSLDFNGQVSGSQAVMNDFSNDRTMGPAGVSNGIEGELGGVFTGTDAPGFASGFDLENSAGNRLGGLGLLEGSPL